MIIFTEHVRDRMQERNISRQAIEEVVRNPEFARRVSDNKVIARKKLNTETIEVVYVVEHSNRIVITCYFE